MCLVALGVSESYIASYQNCWLKNRGCSIHLMQDINIDTNEKKKRRKIKFKWRYKGKKGTYPGHEYDYSAIFIIIGFT